jgi:hypothetical protein
MEQRKISLAVKALWLQYHGLNVEFIGKPCRIENAARGPATGIPSNCLPEPSGFLVAS